MSCHRSDDGVHVFGDQVNVVIPLWIVLLVTDDHFADGNDAVDL